MGFSSWRSSAYLSLVPPPFSESDRYRPREQRDLPLEGGGEKASSRGRCLLHPSLQLQKSLRGTQQPLHSQRSKQTARVYPQSSGAVPGSGTSVFIGPRDACPLSRAPAYQSSVGCSNWAKGLAQNTGKSNKNISPTCV